MRAGSKARRIRAKSSTETAPTRLASEEQYRSLIEHAPDAIVVLDLATDRFVMVNPQAERIFGMSREQLLATGPVAVSPPFQPDGRPSPEAGREYIERAIAGETPTFEWVHRRSDGTDFPCDIRLLRVPAEDRMLIRGSILDVSDRTHAEARLLALEAERVELRALAASSEENARLVEEARAAERRLREVHTLLN